MRLIEKKDKEFTFAANIENSLANAIRRFVNQIPVVAVDEVEITKNDSPLYDETIAHRIGLIPLEMSGDKKDAKLKLEANKEGIVFSEELKGMNVVYGRIPITTLGKNQELSLTATVNLGRGSEHSKYSPGIMNFRNSAEIILDKEFLDQVKKVCPNNEVTEKGNKVVVQDNMKKEVLDACEGVANRVGKKAEVEFKDELVIDIESFGQMDVKSIFKKSIEELKKSLSKVQKSL